MKNKKFFWIIIFFLILIILVVKIIYLNNRDTSQDTNQINVVNANEIQDVIDENIIIEDITENNDMSSTKNTIENACIEDEQNLEIEETDLEIEGFELQGDISYDGDKAKSWNVKLGEYEGLTYYSQIDTRWKNNLYTSTNNLSQTISSSGCGPTCAAIIVSSIKGNITPDTMAELFVQNGYRSPNNGTYWSAYRAIADEFNIGYTETSNFEKAIELVRNNNYVVCSVGNGLFTTGGHFVVIVGIDGNTLKIYDPFNYDGKFETSTRKGKVAVSGNTIYCSITNFKKYANYKGFFCYQNIEHTIISKYKSGQRVLVDIPVKIAWQGSQESYDDSLVDSNGYQFWIKNSVIINNHVYGIGVVCYDGGKTDIIQIFDRQFWCNEEYIF